MEGGLGDKLYQEELRLRDGLEAKYLDGLDVSKEKKDILWRHAQSPAFESSSHNEYVACIKSTYAELSKLVRD